MVNALEMAYKFLPDKFALVNQVFTVFKWYEINREKHIPEEETIIQEFELLKPLKNGFNTQIIIPLVPKFQ